MGSSPSKQTAQVAVSNPQQIRVGCGLCKTRMAVTSKCLQCDLLLCENCRQQHLKDNSDHSVMYIKDIGKKFEILSVKTFTTDLTVIDSVLPDKGDKLWIGSSFDGLLYHIQLQDQDFSIINRINMEVFDMARLSQNKIILLSILECRLKLLNTETGEVTDSVYDVSPNFPISVHVTSNNQVIIGAEDDTRRMVMVFDNKGTRLAVYEHDQHNQPIFTFPVSITSTSNGYIHVVDFHPGVGGRVIVLDRDGCVTTRYTGHPDINRDDPFRPRYIVTTPADRVIVADFDSNALHILDNTGQLVTFINTKDKGILFPYSLAFMDDGHLLIGCATDGTTKDAKLHIMKLSGI